MYQKIFNLFKKDDLRYDLLVNLEYYCVSYCHCPFESFVDNAGINEILKFIEKLALNNDILEMTWAEVDNKFFKKFVNKYV